MTPPEPGTTGRTLTEVSSARMGQVEIGAEHYSALTSGHVIPPGHGVRVVGSSVVPGLGLLLMVESGLITASPPSPAARSLELAMPLSQEERIRQLEQELERLRREAVLRDDLERERAREREREQDRQRQHYLDEARRSERFSTPRASSTLCYSCGQAAERTCTQCGRFFCARHGGDRLYKEGRGDSSTIVTKGLCDACTPNQDWLQFEQGCGVVVFIVIAIVALLFFFSFMSR